MRIVLIPLLLVLLLVSCGEAPRAQETRRVNLCVWSNYIPERVLRNFEKETGIQLNYDTFDSNEALLEKMQSGLAEYDVIVPSDYMVKILRQQKLLLKFDHAQAPNIKNIGARFLNPEYDRGNEYSVPFLWATTGIGYNKKKVQGPVDSWSILWDPKYSGRILMLDDVRECFAAVMKWKGHPLNSTRIEDMEEARSLLVLQKPLLKAYNSSNFDEVLLTGDAWIAHGWSGNIAIVMDQSPDLDYIVPKEGGAMTIENFAIPATAKNSAEAYALINYFLDAKVGAEITNLSRYANTNEAAKAFIKPEILNNRVCYPDEQTLSRCELIQDVGPANQILDRYWTEIKSN